MKNLIIKYWPILIILLLVGIFSFPYWAKGRVPFPADYLVNAFPPWQYYFGLPVKNNAMPDVVTQMYPWKHLLMELWKSGQIPLWNPYNFSGNPFLANYQSAVFHPFNLLFFVLPEITAWSLMILFQPLLAGLFTYLFCRELRLSKAASLLSSGAFMFAGFITVWMAYGTLSYALLWLPLALFALISKKKSYVWFFGFLGIFSLILTQQTPILDLIVRLKVPILSTSAASRIIGIFSFSGAVLAGFGFDKLREDLDKKQFRKIFIAGVLGVIIFATIWWVLLIKKPFTFDHLQIAKRNFALPTALLAAFLMLIGGYWFAQKIFKNKKVIIHNSDNNFSVIAF